MTQNIAVRLGEKELAQTDALVETGKFENRTEVIRAGIRMLAEQERSRLLVEAYKRAYKATPQPSPVGELGATLAAAARQTPTSSTHRTSASSS